MTLPMEGIRVIEAAEFLFAPSAAAVLADWGADVIKIEHPERGDRARAALASGTVEPAEVNYLHHQANRGKRSIAVDLNTKRGMDIVHRLVKDADVFITNFLTTARRRIGIEYEDMVAVNPSLIYMRMNGYGPRGAESERGGFDYAAFWARGGFGDSLGEPGGSVTLQRPGLGDNTGGMFGAGAVAAALFARERTGKGALIDLSLLATAMWVNSLDILATCNGGPKPPRRAKHDMPNPTWNAYQTSDGRWLMLVMFQSDPFWPAFCQAIGLPELEYDVRFATQQARADNSLALILILEEVFATRTMADWARLLDESGCLWTPFRDVSELAGDPQVVENGYLVEVDNVKLVASPPQFDAQPARPLRAGPELGEHTADVLLSIGYSAQELADLREAKIII